MSTHQSHMGVGVYQPGHYGSPLQVNYASFPGHGHLVYGAYGLDPLVSDYQRPARVGVSSGAIQDSAVLEYDRFHLSTPPAVRQTRCRLGIGIILGRSQASRFSIFATQRMLRWSTVVADRAKVSLKLTLGEPPHRV